MLVACFNPGRETGSLPTDTTVVQPADKTYVEKDSLSGNATEPMHDSPTLRADSLKR